MVTRTIEIDYKSVINRAYLPYLKDDTRIQIFFGGSSSGKSVFLAQRDVLKVMAGGRNILVCRQVGRTLRGSVVQEVKKVIDAWGLGAEFDQNKTDGTVTCKNGYQIVFAGLDDVEKLKSLTPAKGVFSDVRVEEATETSKDTIKQLEKRQRGGDEGTNKTLTLSFNPILKSHWIYKEYFEPVSWSDAQKKYKGDGLTILKTTYKNNRWLTKADIHGLENEQDRYYREVYTLGNWGVLGAVIFQNWRIAELSNPEDPDYLPDVQRTNRRHGLDFGYASDPAAYGGSHFDAMRKKIYVYQELYERGLDNEQLAGRIKPMVESDLVTCDSAEPKSIAELEKYGIYSRGAKKGKDSVNFGIQWLKKYEIIVDKSCVNAQNELSTYHWKEDAGGNAMSIPVDKNNHFIDGGLRYAYESDMEDIAMFSSRRY
jgi:phage terminase large subunit